jgi:hypothetical protein
MSPACRSAKHGARNAPSHPGPDQHFDEDDDEDDRAMQIAAAQLRLVTDRRLGKPTPAWVKELASEVRSQTF